MLYKPRILDVVFLSDMPEKFRLLIESSCILFAVVPEADEMNVLSYLSALFGLCVVATADAPHEIVLFDRVLP
jgi:hypothetical protein